MMRWLSLFCACSLGFAFGDDTDATEVPFEPRRVVKAFPAITDPELVAGKAADFVDGDELVLGVVVGDRARAYPINMLTGPQREIINDTLGGRAIAATW